MRKLDEASPLPVVAAGAALANAGIFMVVALKDISQLALVSLLPLGAALLLLRFAPGATAPMLSRAVAWIELHARTIALIVATVLAASLLRQGIAGLGG